MNTQKLTEKSTLYKDLTVYYYVKGNPKHPSIVLLHPAFANHKIFNMQISFLSEEYYVIAVDMVSHGKSQNFKSNVNMSDMADIVESILSIENAHHVHLLGVSLGSLIAQRIADKYPNRVHTVTVVGGYSIHKDNHILMKKQQKEIFKWLFYLLLAPKKFKQYIIKNTCFSKDSYDVFELSLSEFKRSQLRGMNGMNSVFHKINHSVSYPLLIVYGEHELPLLQKANDDWTRAEKMSRLEIIPNAGHCANIDNYSFFNKVFRNFIDDSIKH